MKGLVCAFWLIIAFATSPEAWSGGGEFTVQTTLSSRAAQAAVRRAVLGARNRLARPRCRSLLSEFKDEAGRRLEENLDAGETAASYLGRILFADGSQLRQCQDFGVFALTPTGSRTIYICGPQFALGDSIRPAITEAIIIHEELHSLGLGENPPSSTEITSRVFERCQS